MSQLYEKICCKINSRKLATTATTATNEQFQEVSVATNLLQSATKMPIKESVATCSKNVANQNSLYNKKNQIVNESCSNVANVARGKNTNVHTGQVSEEVIANIHYYGGYSKPEPFWEQIFKVSVIPCPYTAMKGDIRLPWSWVEREQCHTRCKKRHKECVLEYIETLQRKQGETCA